MAVVLFIVLDSGSDNGSDDGGGSGAGKTTATATTASPQTLMVSDGEPVGGVITAALLTLAVLAAGIRP